MSKRLLQIAGALLLVASVGIVSCQALFADAERPVQTIDSAAPGRP